MMNHERSIDPIRSGMTKFYDRNYRLGYVGIVRNIFGNKSRKNRGVYLIKCFAVVTVFFFFVI